MKTNDYTRIILQTPLIGKDMYHLIDELYPICRSITGNGVRDTHKIIEKHVSIKTFEVPSGKNIFDWTIPKEWNIQDAYVLDPKKNKIIDFQKSNLHVVNYSIPINMKIPLKELKKHLHSLPEQPSEIPYRTTYYTEDWGFCISNDQLLKLEDGEYTVVINSSLENGHLTYSEYYLKGKKEDEILITCYTCHPSMCNDNLSGVALVTFLAKHLSEISLEYSYRFLFIPETIGAIAWLSVNEKNISRIKCGLVVTCIGDSGNLTYKKSRQGDAEIDTIAINVLRNSGNDYDVMDFFPLGSDERQFCSPGFNLEVGSLMRTMYGNFKEYHTSADNLEFMNLKSLEDSFVKYLKIIFALENNKTYITLNPNCEPHLGKYGLYPTMGGQKTHDTTKQAIQWILNLSDGTNSLLDISNKSNLEFDLIKNTADVLTKNKLLKEYERF
jgi:aminopeptidase-like protein